VYRHAIRKILSSATKVVTESLWERRLIHELCGRGVNTEVNIIGIDTTVFHPPENRANLRDKYGLARDAFIVVSNRFLNGRYNGWLVVEAIEGIVKNCPGLVLLYLNPTRPDSQTKTKMECITSRFPQIRFLDGGVPQPTVAEILSCGDVYMSLSSVDGVPNSVLEAMACGCVPIVGDLPQLHEWIDDGKTGFIVPQRDREEVSSLIRRLYKRPDKLAEMSKHCSSKIRTEGQSDVCLTRTRDMLKSLVISTSPGQRGSELAVSRSYEAAYHGDAVNFKR
jgi:glycosyltransferase involved in cell wall biosynthesis